MAEIARGDKTGSTDVLAQLLIGMSVLAVVCIIVLSARRRRAASSVASDTGAVA